tara:strand:- start:909 stop:1271 length:363 start_codon:yes stop_codon:yes gene_type:complete
MESKGDVPSCDVLRVTFPCVFVRTEHAGSGVIGAWVRYSDLPLLDCVLNRLCCGASTVDYAQKTTEVGIDLSRVMRIDYHDWDLGDDAVLHAGTTLAHMLGVSSVGTRSTPHSLVTVVVT